MELFYVKKEDKNEFLRTLPELGNIEINLTLSQFQRVSISFAYFLCFLEDVIFHFVNDVS